MYLHNSRTMDMATTSILFIEFPELLFHLDPVIDSVYITGTCHFRLYFFYRRDIVVPFSHPLFDLATPFIAIPIHMAHPATPPTTPPVPSPTSPPQIVPSLSLLMMMTKQRQQTHLPDCPPDLVMALL